MKVLQNSYIIQVFDLNNKKFQKKKIIKKKCLKIWMREIIQFKNKIKNQNLNYISFKKECKLFKIEFIEYYEIKFWSKKLFFNNKFFKKYCWKQFFNFFSYTIVNIIFFII